LKIAIQGNGSEIVLVGIAYDQVYSRQGCDFFWGSLGVAAGDDDAYVRVLAAHAADGGARILVGAIGHRAGIQNDDGGVLGAGRAGQPTLLELAFKSSAVRLRGAASKILYKEFGHTLWYRTPESV